MKRSLWLRYHYHRLRRLASNFSLLRYRDCDGFILSMHQAGTHWLKYMLAEALARRYGLPRPRYNHANDIIGGPKDPVLHRGAPVIKSAHSLPPLPLYSARLYRRLAPPRYLVLVRDPRAALVSNYCKWRERYGVGFAEYLRGDPAGHRYNSDIWWCLRFMNAWGAIAARQPAAVQVLRYEQLQQNPEAGLAAAGAHLGCALRPADRRFAVAAGSRERMLAREDPARPAGAVRLAGRPWPDWYGPGERAFVAELARSLLRHDFGYDLTRWPASSA